MKHATPRAWGALLTGGLVAGTRPCKPGVYERLTPSFGVTVDAWDGEQWRRLGKTVEPYRPVVFAGVICANQNWPWRPPAPA